MPIQELRILQTEKYRSEIFTPVSPEVEISRHTIPLRQKLPAVQITILHPLENIASYSFMLNVL